MLSRKFTFREKILLIIMVILLMGMLYYQFVIKAAEEAVVKYDTTELETDLLIEQTKAEAKLEMLDEIEKSSGQDTGFVASYNNIKNEIRALNDIFDGAIDYNINFQQAVKDGECVRRDIVVNFETTTYSKARSILESLRTCQYRCLIKNLDISAKNSDKKGIKSGGGVQVSLTATFYETMLNADTTLGLDDSNEETVTQSQTIE